MFFGLERVMSMSRVQLFEWSCFALIGVLVCLLLAFRPIPKADSANDTVRYVSDLHQYCGGGLSNGMQLNKEISYQFFYSVTSIACLADSDGVFLFEVALFLPLMFLLFASWKNGTLLWACGLLFSVYGLELMTNAMRQGLAMLLFFGGVALVHKHPRTSFLLAMLAVVAHTSVLPFLPFLLWVSGVRLSRAGKIIGIIFSLFIIAIAWIFYGIAIAGFLEGISELHDFYTAIYVEQLKPSFILFMVLPLYFVYGLRYCYEKQSISPAEQKAVVYSTLLILTAFIAFPAISYRFAVFAIPLQIFTVSISEQHSTKVGGFAMIGMMVHLSIMIFMSNNYSVLIYG